MEGKFIPIILIGMSRYCLLDEVDNKQIQEDVLKKYNTRMNFDTEDSSIEDTVLAKTYAISHLINKIDNIGTDSQTGTKAVEVDIQREIAISMVDQNAVKSEEIKGKVKTKKDKLRALRRRNGR